MQLVRPLRHRSASIEVLLNKWSINMEACAPTSSYGDLSVAVASFIWPSLSIVAEQQHGIVSCAFSFLACLQKSI